MARIVSLVVLVAILLVIAGLFFRGDGQLPAAAVLGAAAGGDVWAAPRLVPTALPRARANRGRTDHRLDPADGADSAACCY